MRSTHLEPDSEQSSHDRLVHSYLMRPVLAEKTTANIAGKKKERQKEGAMEGRKERPWTEGRNG